MQSLSSLEPPSFLYSYAPRTLFIVVCYSQTRNPRSDPDVVRAGFFWEVDV